MRPPFSILAIESSCDETSAAVIGGSLKIGAAQIKSNIVSSQINLHRATGGVVPEVAAREHVRAIIPVIERALGGRISKKIKNIDAIAVTSGPGLAGSLLVGVETARAIASACNKPLIPINHLEGHIFSALVSRKEEKTDQRTSGGNAKLLPPKTVYIPSYDYLISKLPALALVASGGHTSLFLVKNGFKYKTVGETLDDAAGEAFDKVAAVLGLSYPGGPSVERAAAKAGERKTNNADIKLPRPMLKSGDLNFSFSGLKTAVINLVKKKKKDGAFSPKTKLAVACEFQNAVVDVLAGKTFQAFLLKSKDEKINSVLLSGGVSANRKLRLAFKKQFGKKLLISPRKLTGDNAGMIGLAAFYRYAKYKNKTADLFRWQKITADPNLSLSS